LSNLDSLLFFYFFIILILNDKTWNVKVPNNKKGLFIGKGGANIKALADKYNVKINVI